MKPELGWILAEGYFIWEVLQENIWLWTCSELPFSANCLPPIPGRKNILFICYLILKDLLLDLRHYFSSSFSHLCLWSEDGDRDVTGHILPIPCVDQLRSGFISQGMKPLLPCKRVKLDLLPRMDNGANTAHMYMVPMLPATINAISLWNPWGTEQDSLSVVITVIVTEQVLDLHVKHEKKKRKKKEFTQR